MIHRFTSYLVACVYSGMRDILTTEMDVRLGQLLSPAVCCAKARVSDYTVWLAMSFARGAALVELLKHQAGFTVPATNSMAYVFANGKEWQLWYDTQERFLFFAQGPIDTPLKSVFHSIPIRRARDLQFYVEARVHPEGLVSMMRDAVNPYEFMTVKDWVKEEA